MKRERSENLYSELCEVVPGGVNSPVRAYVGLGLLPMVAERGKGALLYDVDGNEFIDYCGSWGPLILGHAEGQVIEAIQKRALLGTSFGVTTEIEGRLARKVREMMPSLEKVRFVSSGTEAAMSVVRLARGFTKREIVVKFNGHYHGHADLFLVQAGSSVTHLSPTSSSAGVPQDSVKYTYSLPFNDIDAVYDFLKSTKVACVILEPIAGNMGVVPAHPAFLQMLREETKRQGALLIFDEVMTGFRVAKGGAQELYGITPDLTCLGKIVGGGLPAAAYGGKREIMDYLAPLGPVFQAGTLSGNPLAMEAGYQTLELISAPGFYEELERKTRLLTDPIVDYLERQEEDACLQRVGSMFTLFFGLRSVKNMEQAKKGLDLEKFASFFRTMFEQGIYVPPSQFEAWMLSAAHTETELIKTKDRVIDFLERR